MKCRLEAWHPDQALRWSALLEVELPVGMDAPLPILPDLASLRDFHGQEGWVLRFQHAEDALQIGLCTEAPSWAGNWEEAEAPVRRAPWSVPAWRREVEAWIHRQVGPHTLHQHRVWGRSAIWRVEVGETLWFKQSYGLPPGEGTALRLATRAQGRLKVVELVAGEGTRALMRPVARVDLRERPTQDWVAALKAVLDFAESVDVDPWIEAGTRDWREGWYQRLGVLFGAYGFDPDLADRLAPRFEGLPGVVLPQDLGPCNLRWLGEDRVQGFDWSDVVISFPGLILQRFLNEARHLAKFRGNSDEPALITAFGDPRGWTKTLACAPLHETCRYHAELEWLDEDDPLAVWLRASNARQLKQILQVEAGS